MIPNYHFMNPSFYNFLFSLCFVLFSGTIPAMAQGCTTPTEQVLNKILRQINLSNKHQRLHIAGMVAGKFSNKEQLDYVCWLKEQESLPKQQQRQLIKLSCIESEWTITATGFIPAGVVIADSNFIDVTGDSITELIYQYSYMGNDCVDGCAILSLQGNEFRELYHNREAHTCQNIDWHGFPSDSLLPFVAYSLQYLAQNRTSPAQLIEYRMTKKHIGGITQQEILEHAQVDTSSIILKYDRFNQRFVQPIDLPCNNEVLPNMPIGYPHPAIEKAIEHLNRKGQQFHIEGIYHTALTHPNQTDYLVYSNAFTLGKNNIKKRKVVKIVCADKDWKVAGLMYVNGNFSDRHIQDVNGDGVDEIIDESTTTADSFCVQHYKILSFKGKIGKLLYAHRNTYQQCQNNATTTPIGATYDTSFQDIDNDGIKEIIQTSNTGTITFKYNAHEERYLPEKE